MELFNTFVMLVMETEQFLFFVNAQASHIVANYSHREVVNINDSQQDNTNCIIIVSMFHSIVSAIFISRLKSVKYTFQILHELH